VLLAGAAGVRPAVFANDLYRHKQARRLRSRAIRSLSQPRTSPGY